MIYYVASRWERTSVYTFDQLFKYSQILLSRNDFFIKMFFKQSLNPLRDLNVFVHSLLFTTVPLNIICGWFGLEVLQENKTSVACLWAYGVVVSMFDFHRSDRGSNPGRAGKISFLFTTTL